MSQATCGRFAEFVLNASEQGLNSAQITRVWITANPQLKAGDTTALDPEVCGGVAEILKAAGKKVT